MRCEEALQDQRDQVVGRKRPVLVVGTIPNTYLIKAPLLTYTRGEARTHQYVFLRTYEQHQEAYVVTNLFLYVTPLSQNRLEGQP